MKTNQLVLPLFAFIAGLALVASSLVFFRPFQVSGSTLVGNDYMSTTTGAATYAGNTITGGQVCLFHSTSTSQYDVGKQGSLGSVIVTGAAAGSILVYDATTTNVALRGANAASSTILVAELPPSLAAGTYVFDRQLTTGLCLVFNGTTPTTTITYR